MGIFSTPGTITTSVGSVGAALLLWVLGLLLSFAGLYVWLEFGCMFPRSGGGKVYLKAVYRWPRFLATVVFSTQTILLSFTGELKAEPLWGFFLPHEVFHTAMGEEYDVNGSVWL